MDSRAGGWGRTLFYLVGWAASVALMIVDIFALRAIVQGIMAWIDKIRPRDPVAEDFGWTMEAVDRWLMLTLACVGVALVVVVEYYFRGALAEAKSSRSLPLWQRIVRVLGVQVAVAIAGFVVWRVMFL